LFAFFINVPFLFFVFVLRCLCGAELRSSSKAGVVIEFNGFEPGLDVFARFGMFAQVFCEERKRFRVAVRSRFSMKADQASISHGARGVLELDWIHSRSWPSPCQQPTLSTGQQDRTKEPDKVLVRRGIVIIFPFFSASVARPLSNIRAKITKPPKRTRKLRGGR